MSKREYSFGLPIAGTILGTFLGFAHARLDPQPESPEAIELRELEKNHAVIRYKELRETGVRVDNRPAYYGLAGLAIGGLAGAKILSKRKKRDETATA